MESSLQAAKRDQAKQREGERGAVLSLELTRNGAIWAISQSLVRALGYTHVGKQSLLGKSMLISGQTLVEAADLNKFIDAFEKAREALDERLQQQQQPSSPGNQSINGDDDEAFAEATVAGGATANKLSDATVWLQTASGGRICLQVSFDFAMLDVSFHEDTGGPAGGLIMLTMIDVTVAERNKELVARRYELAYNEKAADSQLIEFFAAYVEESPKSVPVPGRKNRSASPGPEGGPSGGGADEELSPGVRTYLERRKILITAFPDLQFQMLEQTTQGSSVYTSWQYTGTHLGPYPAAHAEDDALPPSGARVHVHGISIDVFVSGRIVDHSVFYDEAAIRAQLELKASQGKGRDTRSILRRAHAERVQAAQETPIQIQLYLKVTKSTSGEAVVGAMMRPVVSTAPRYSAQELAMMSTMENYYASKATAQIGSFTTDGFCLCDAGPNSPPSAATGSPTKADDALPPHTPTAIILCSKAFARIVKMPANSLLRADIHGILEPAVRRTDPDVAVRLQRALAKQEPFHAVFEAHIDDEGGDSFNKGRRSSTDDSQVNLSSPGKYNSPVFKRRGHRRVSQDTLRREREGGEGTSEPASLEQFSQSDGWGMMGYGSLASASAPLLRRESRERLSEGSAPSPSVSRRSSLEEAADGAPSIAPAEAPKEPEAKPSPDVTAAPPPSPGRVFAIDAAPFVHERRLYWSILLSDLSDDLVLNNVDTNGRRPPGAFPDSMASGATTAGFSGDSLLHNSPPLKKEPSPPPKGPNGIGLLPQLMKRRVTTSKKGKQELADQFVHCVPSSWRWFNCKMLQEVIAAALHAFNNAALSLSDLRGEDAPLVWIAEGFARLNGWSRIEAIGRNCRFLQSDASSPDSIYEMRRAIAARVHTRVYLWNEAIDGEGFWTILSLVPGRGDPSLADNSSNSSTPAVIHEEGSTGSAPPIAATTNAAEVRYMMGVQHRLTKQDMRFVFEKVLSYRTAHWELPSPKTSNFNSPLMSPFPPPPQGGPLPPPQLHAPIPQSPLAPSAAAPPPASPVPATGDMTAALGAWEREHVRVHGRKPTAQEVSAMVLEAYSKLQQQVGITPLQGEVELG